MLLFLLKQHPTFKYYSYQSYSNYHIPKPFINIFSFPSYLFQKPNTFNISQFPPPSSFNSKSSQLISSFSTNLVIKTVKNSNNKTQYQIKSTYICIYINQFQNNSNNNQISIPLCSNHHIKSFSYNNFFTIRVILRYLGKNTRSFMISKNYNCKTLTTQPFSPSTSTSNTNTITRVIPPNTGWKTNTASLSGYCFTTHNFLQSHSIHSYLIPTIQSHTQWYLLSQLFYKQPQILHYFYLSLKKTKSHSWKIEQDHFLQNIMNSSYYKKWTEIGIEMFVATNGFYFRKPKAIRERWLSHLNPQLKKLYTAIFRDDWTHQQDLKLLKNIRELGKKWSKISQIFGTRSQHTIKNRYNQLLLKYTKQKRQPSTSHYCHYQSQILNQIQKQLITQLKKSECPTLQSISSSLSDQNLITNNIPHMKLFCPILLSPSTLENIV